MVGPGGEGISSVPMGASYFPVRCSPRRSIWHTGGVKVVSGGHRGGIRAMRGQHKAVHEQCKSGIRAA